MQISQAKAGEEEMQVSQAAAGEEEIVEEPTYRVGTERSSPSGYANSKNDHSAEYKNKQTPDTKGTEPLYGTIKWRSWKGTCSTETKRAALN